MSPETIIIRPEDLRELREIAAEEGVRVQSLVDVALSNFLSKKYRERFPEFAKLIDGTLKRNRTLYEMLAREDVSFRQSGPENPSSAHH